MRIILFMAVMITQQLLADEFACTAVEAYSENREVVNFSIIGNEMTFHNGVVWGRYSRFTTFYRAHLGLEGLSIAEGVEDRSGRNYRALLELRLNYSSKEGTMNVGDRIIEDESIKRMGKFKEYFVKCL